MRKVLLFSTLLALPACRPAPPSPKPVATPPVAVVAYTQYSAGDTLEYVRMQLGLDDYPARYRSGMPERQMGAVYFLENGNLHIDAKLIGQTWVILSTPLMEPSTIPAAARVAAWDSGADSQRSRSKSDK